MLNKLQAMRKNLKKKGKGFTLVELVVVIIIIAIIAAVALPRIAAFQESARKSRIESEHRQLVTAIQSRISQSDEPTEEYKKITSLDTLGEYMNVKAGKKLSETVAKDAGKVAHEISGTKLISKYTDPNGGAKSETLEYEMSTVTPKP